MLRCRFCEGELNRPFVSLGASPLSNAYLSEADLSRMEPHYPLDVYLCDRCLLVQLPECASAQTIFDDAYAYFSSFSESWLRHCEAYVRMVVPRLGLGRESFVVEIASNDGYLLQYFHPFGVPVLGVEPAANTAAAARGKGIPTEVAFFDTAFAEGLRREGRQADLLIGNNVLAHNPNLNDFVRGLKIALKPGGTVTMEFPHLLQLISLNQFDTIYHEHFSYFSFLAVEGIFAAHGLTLYDVEELPTHGGSLRIYGRHAEDGARPVSPRVQELRRLEERRGYRGRAPYLAFQERVKATKREILAFLIEAKNRGKRIVGYGAPAKGNTLLNYCGIGTDFLDYTVDRSPHKQNRYLPGSRIPIRHPDAIREDKPDYLFLLPWNIKDEIMEQMAFVREWGGRFVVPIPSIAIFP